MDESIFEEEVRTVARALWPSARFGGVKNIDIAEHDAVFFAQDTVHCVECTVSGRRDKAKHDAEKLKKAIDKWTGVDDRLAKGWFITLNDPTPDQSAVIKKIDPRITAISYLRFKARLMDIYLYDQLRMNTRFGSSSNPAADSDELEPYVPITLSLLDESGAAQEQVKLTEVIKLIGQGQRIALVGDYGIGKSMNLREIYRRLTSQVKAHKELNSPVHINLRDHWGQKSPSAALTQHAEDIGYGHPEQLISAWRAGFIHILLDGFDEVAAPGWSGDIRSLRSSRRRAVELVRQFIRQTPKRAGVVVAGRQHYFDSLPELRECLFDGSPHVLFELGEFGPQEIRSYLRKNKNPKIPSWLPTRPLLLGHLAARGVFSRDLNQETENMNPAESWDWLLNMVSTRESEIVEAGLSGSTVRQIIEQLASQARNSTTGVGPLSQREITDAFIKVRGQEPSDSEQAILQRLPGLARDPDAEEGTRSFIDADFASVAQARDISNLALSPYQDIDERAAKWAASLTDLGIEVAAHQYSVVASDNGPLLTAHKYAARKGLNIAQADLVRLSVVLGYEMAESILVDSAHIPALSFYEGMPDLSAVSFSDCLFDRIEFGDDIPPDILPTFSNCYIDAIYGRLGKNDLPVEVFISGCDFGAFPDAADRNDAILSADLPAGVRVLLTVLRKLYLQPGRGRLEGALSRGMSQDERGRVTECLKLLQRVELASPIRIKSRTIWIPNRTQRSRALRFIEAPRGSGDSLYRAASKI